MVDNFKPVKRKPATTNSESSGDHMESDEEPSFEPPEVVAANSEADIPASRLAVPKTKDSTNKRKKHFLQNLTKKQWIIIGVVAVLLIGSGVGAFFAFHKKPVKTAPPAKIAATPPPPPPTTEASTLTGLMVPIGNNKFPVTGVMIENSPDARPQSGLLDAGVVFEAIAEGGITRFLALYQSDSVPSYVGPVRSARPYYLDYLSGFDGAIAHVGGSPDALGQIKAQGIKDLDEFANAGAYQRINTRFAPHNVYTSLANLYGLQKAKGFSSSFTGFARKVEVKPTAAPAAKSIDMAISGVLYNAHYDYDVSTNSYLRSEGGKPHTDERSSKQLNPKNVVAIVVNETLSGDRIHSVYSDLGSGKAFIFRDGTVNEGIWTKSDRKAQIKFTDASGNVIGLNPGQTWITLVGTATDVSYRP